VGSLSLRPVAATNQTGVHHVPGPAGAGDHGQCGGPAGGRQDADGHHRGSGN